MTIYQSRLPDDAHELKAMLSSAMQELAQRDDELAAQVAIAGALRSQIADRDTEIEALKLLIAKLRRMHFGRKSEKVAHQIDQLELKLEELQAEAGGHSYSDPIAPSRSAGKSSREPIPTHVPREERLYQPNLAACPACGAGMRYLGEDVSEQLEYVPASFKVIRHIRPKYTCRCCDQIVQEPAPSRPIARGLAGPGLLSHVLVSKFADHLPLYRQSVIYARQGVQITRATLADWVGASSALLRPLIDAIRRHVMAADKLHADDTPVPVLAPGAGKTKMGRLWTYVRDDRPSGSSTAPAVWFAYTPDRKGMHPQSHLANYRGVLQADAYAGFSRLYDKGTIVEAACWAHARRKIHDLHIARPSAFTTEVLRRIAELYAIEGNIRGRPPDERKRIRQLQARPLLNDLHILLRNTFATLSRKSDMALAILYSLNLWPALTRYCDDGRIEIDNSAAERALRGIAIGRRNYLFAGADSGGERAAAIYSLIGTAKLNGVDPEVWLRHVLTHISDHPVNRVDEFLPWHFTGTAGLPDPSAM